MNGTTDSMKSAAARTVSVSAALLLLVFAFVPFANLATARRSAPWYGHVVFYWIVIGGALLLVLLALARWSTRPVERLERAVASFGMRMPAWLVVGSAACAAAIASMVIFVVCFNRQPHDADEVANLFHAKILASGRFSLPVDANPEFFAMDDMIDRGRWYSHFPVGGPALFVAGVMLGAPWLINPIFVGLTVIAVYAFVRRTYGEAMARASAVLFAFTPFALFMAASYMNHSAAILLATVALWALARWTDAGTARDAHRAAAMLGFALGFTFIIRPVDALALAAMIGLFQLVELRRVRWRVTSLAWQVAAGVLPVLVLFYANWRTTGAPLRLGYEVLYGTAHQLGFHDDPYGVPFTPRRALALLSKYVLQLDVVLFEWPIPALGLLAAGLLALRRPTRWDVLLIGVFFAQCAAYALYWGDGMFRGPRYLFTAIVAVVILVARAAFVLTAASHGTVRRALAALVPACVLFAWLVPTNGAGVPLRARAYEREPARYRVEPAAIARAAGLHNALVFVNEDSRSRTLHRLWSLGLGRGDAARLMDSAPTCAVRLAVDAEEARAPTSTEGRLQRLIDVATRLDSTALASPGCQDDARRDAAGWTTYMPFFAANEIGRDGRLAGDVVYALDLGKRDELLRPRFGNRMWYRFGSGLERY